MKRPVKPDIFVKRILSDIRVGELDPREIKDLKEFVKTSKYKKTITTRTKLSLLYAIWLNEKQKRNRKTTQLKKAEKILNAQTLTFWEVAVRRRGYEKERTEKGKRQSKWQLGPSHAKANPLKDLKKNLKKLGIVAEEMIEKLLDTLKKTKNLMCEIDAINELDKRVRTVLEEFKGNISYARKVFAEKPMLLAKPDLEFNKLIKTMKLDVAHKQMSPEGAIK